MRFSARSGDESPTTNKRAQFLIANTLCARGGMRAASRNDNGELSNRKSEIENRKLI